MNQSRFEDRKKHSGAHDVVKRGDFLATVDVRTLQEDRGR